MTSRGTMTAAAMTPALLSEPPSPSGSELEAVQDSVFVDEEDEVYGL